MIKLLTILSKGRLFKFLSNFTETKCVALVIAFILAFIDAAGAGIIGLFLLTTIDMYFGIKASMKEKHIKLALFKKHFWQSIKSGGLRQTGTKFFLEFLPIIFSAHVFETLILKNSFLGDIGFSLTMASILLLAFVELWSIGENYAKVRGMNPFKALLSYFVKKESISDIVDDTINDIKDAEPDSK